MTPLWLLWLAGAAAGAGVVLVAGAGVWVWRLARGPQLFRCEACGELCSFADPTWGWPEALAEMQRRYGELSVDERAIVCDACWLVFNDAAWRWAVERERALRRAAAELHDELYEAVEDFGLAVARFMFGESYVEGHRLLAPPMTYDAAHDDVRQQADASKLPPPAPRIRTAPGDRFGGPSVSGHAYCLAEQHGGQCCGHPGQCESEGYE